MKVKAWWQGVKTTGAGLLKKLRTWWAQKTKVNSGTATLFWVTAVGALISWRLAGVSKGIHFPVPTGGVSLAVIIATVVIVVAVVVGIKLVSTRASIGRTGAILAAGAVVILAAAIATWWFWATVTGFFTGALSYLTFGWMLRAAIPVIIVTLVLVALSKLFGLEWLAKGAYTFGVLYAGLWALVFYAGHNTAATTSVASTVNQAQAGLTGDIEVSAGEDSIHLLTRPGYNVSFTGDQIETHCVYRDGRPEGVVGDSEHPCSDGPMREVYVHNRSGNNETVSYRFEKVY